MWSRTKQIRKQSSRTVTRPSADFQTKFFRRFKQLRKFSKKVAQRSRDSGWRSCDRRSTVKQRFLDVSSNSVIFWKKSLNGHATVVGGHATVGRLSNRNVFWTFQAIRIFFKVAERSRDNGRRSRDRLPIVKQRVFGRFKQNLENFWKKSLNGHATVVGGHATVGRLSNNVFSTFQTSLEFFLEKSLNGHATVVGGHATVGRLSNNVAWTFQAIRWNFVKKVADRSRDSASEVTRPSADCQTTIFSTISSN